MLFVKKLFSEALCPTYATPASSCFDLHACLLPQMEIKRRGLSNEEYVIKVSQNQTIEIGPGHRILIPTGLIFYIPENHSLRLHPRSGLAFKNGISLINCEGVIDEDYIDPVFIALINNSKEPFAVSHGDRICQGELVADTRTKVIETYNELKTKTGRNGGFGSTGI